MFIKRFRLFFIDIFKGYLNVFMSDILKILNSMRTSPGVYQAAVHQHLPEFKRQRKERGPLR